MQLPKLLFAIALLVGSGLLTPLPASTPKFTVTQSDNRFSADGSTTYSASGNRISRRSIAGGVHIDKSGVYLDPSVILEPTSHDVKIIVLHLLNVTDRYGIAGAPNSFGRPNRITFITGEGAPIILEFAQGRQTFGESNCRYGAMGCITPITELGSAKIDARDYSRLITATALAIKVDGSERSHIYETADIAPSFIANLTSFYNHYIVKKP